MRSCRSAWRVNYRHRSRAGPALTHRDAREGTWILRSRTCPTASRAIGDCHDGRCASALQTGPHPWRPGMPSNGMLGMGSSTLGMSRSRIQAGDRRRPSATRGPAGNRPASPIRPRSGSPRCWSTPAPSSRTWEAKRERKSSSASPPATPACGAATDRSPCRSLPVQRAAGASRASDPRQQEQHLRPSRRRRQQPGHAQCSGGRRDGMIQALCTQPRPSPDRLAGCDWRRERRWPRRRVPCLPPVPLTSSARTRTTRQGGGCDVRSARAASRHPACCR